MGIFGRINTVLSSNLNALLDEVDDPAKQIAQTIRDMEREIKAARGEILTVRATAKRLRKGADEAAAEAADWDSKAVLAVRAGDDGLARQALKQKARCTKKAEGARQDADRHDGMAARMQDTLEQCEQRVSDLQARQGTLAAQINRARQAPAGLGSATGSHFGELERLNGRIEQMEAEVEAADVLQTEPTVEELQARFAKLEQQAESAVVDDELSDLKKRLDG